LTPIGTKSFVGWGFAPDLIAVLWGLQGVRPLPWEEKRKVGAYGSCRRFIMFMISVENQKRVMTKMLAVVLFYCY